MARLQSLFGFGPAATVEVKFNAPKGLTPTDVKDDTKVEEDLVERPTRRVETMDGTSTEDLVIFAGSERVTGFVDVVVPAGKKLEHIGIKLELLGNIGACCARLWRGVCVRLGRARHRSPASQPWCAGFGVWGCLAELYYDRGNHHEFAQQLVIVATPGVIQGTKRFEFDFDAPKPYETYNGVNVRCRYFVRATVSRSYNSNIVKEQDFWVENIQKVRHTAVLAAGSLARPLRPQPRADLSAPRTVSALPGAGDQHNHQDGGRY